MQRKKNKVMGRELKLGQTTSKRMADFVRWALADKYNVDCYFYATGQSDTTFTYILYTNDVLKVAEVPQVLAFVSGMLETWRLVA